MAKEPKMQPVGTIWAQRRGRRRVDHGPSAIAYLRNELKLSWREIARFLNTSVRTVRRVYARTIAPTVPLTIQPTPWQNSNPAIPVSGPDGNSGMEGKTEGVSVHE